MKYKNKIKNRPYIFGFLGRSKRASQLLVFPYVSHAGNVMFQDPFGVVYYSCMNTCFKPYWMVSFSLEGGVNGLGNKIHSHQVIETVKTTSARLWISDIYLYIFLNL